MKVSEAKELLRRRYQKRKHPVLRIAHRGGGFLVSFGSDEKGRGLGPRGVVSLRCNWPTQDSGTQTEIDFTARKRRRKK
jgi:hypothetical protein